MPSHCSIEGCTPGYDALQDHQSEEKLLKKSLLKAKIATKIDQILKQEGVGTNSIMYNLREALA